MKQKSNVPFLLDLLTISQLPRKRILMATLAVSFSMALVACGGSGDEGTPVVPQSGVLSLAAGTIETFNGTGAQARISEPTSIAVDSSGNTYLTELGLSSVRKISPAGVVTVFAGDALNSGDTDGVGTEARFSNPGAITIDRDDNIYVLDKGVRKITPSGLVTTIPGSSEVSGTAIAVDPTGGFFVWGSDGLRKIAIDGSVKILPLPMPMLAMRRDVYLAAGNSGNLFIASGTTRFDYSGAGGGEVIPLLHKLTPAGVLTQIYEFSTKDVDGAVFNFGGIAVDGAENVYISNGIFTLSLTPNNAITSIGNTILKLSSQGVLTTIAGARGQVGFNDGQGVNAKFNEPGKLAVDRQGNLIVADVRNGTIRAISSSGAVSTLAGRAPDSVDGQGDKGQLKAVVGLASDQRGNVVVTEYSALRSLSPNGMLTTTVKNENGRFQNLALDSRGFMYVTSYAGMFSAIYQYAPSGVGIRTQYGSETSLAVDAQDNLYGASGAIKNLTSGKIIADLGNGYPQAFVFDSRGNAYVADRSRSKILQVSPAGVVSTLAGIGSEPGYKDGAAGTAQFNAPEGIAVLGTDVYVADTGNNLIRKISQEGNVTTVAGTPGSLDSVMGQPGSLYRPTYLTTESNSSLLVVADRKAIVRIRLQ